MDTKQEKRKSRPRPTPKGKNGSGQRPSAERTEAEPQPKRRRRAQPEEKNDRRKARPKQRRAAAEKPRPTPKRPPAEQKKRKPAPTPDVVYTPPRPFNRGRLLVQLTTIVAVVLALSFGISVFFKVENITVSGVVKYDPWTIKEASGIEIGDNLLSFGEARAAGKIKTALPYVESVRIGIKLPDTVNIEIKELDVVYAIQDIDNNWWLITAEGKVVEKTDRDTADKCAEIIGFHLASPLVGQQAVAHEAPVATDAQDSTDPTAVTSPVATVRAADQLKAALQILQYLEECGIIGEVTSVNVTDLGNLELNYGQRFRVKLGDTTQLLYKIQCMNAAINGKDPENTLKEYDSGVLDISFTIKENQVIYQPGED